MEEEILTTRICYYNLKPDQTLGRNYYVVEFVGSGWEGEVYKVAERRTGILRAAKIFYEGHRLTDTRMQRYARKLYRLRNCPIITQYHHRDIARVGREQVEIMVSDFVEGELLSSFLLRQNGKKLTSFEALHLLHALAAGVEQIHYSGEYHGDIHSDNILVKRKGLEFKVHLVDFFDLGRSTKEKIQNDVIELITILHELIGGPAGYRKADSNIRSIILGRKHTLIRKRFKNAGQLRLALENLKW
jgi:tRNA A-37 threonylcarbamoyl transferase component Bud32